MESCFCLFQFLLLLYRLVVPVHVDAFSSDDAGYDHLSGPSDDVILDALRPAAAFLAFRLDCWRLLWCVCRHLTSFSQVQLMRTEGILSQGYRIIFSFTFLTV